MGTEPRALLPLAALLAAVLAAPAVAEGHAGKVERTLLLEPAGEELQVLLHLEIRGRDRRQAMFLLADADRDGRLSPAEEGELERVLAGRALDGVRLWLGEAALVLEGVRAKVRFEEDGPAALALHGRAVLPPGATRLAVSTEPSGEPLKLMILPGTRPPQGLTRGRRRGPGVEVALGPGDRVAWRLEGP